VAADSGIAITGLHCPMLAPSGLSITSADAAVRTRSVDVMRRLCDLAADLGASVLVHGASAQQRLERGKEAEDRKWGTECLAAVADAASLAIYCIEPLDASPARRLGDRLMRDFSRDLAHLSINTATLRKQLNLLDIIACCAGVASKASAPGAIRCTPPARG
jgi:NAD(P)-dependent dehydrogenase (short-subunit alcohol dehydrogenase family)